MITESPQFNNLLETLKTHQAVQRRNLELEIENIQLREAVIAERESCAMLVEKEEGFQIAYYEDSERPTQVSQVDILQTLSNIATAIRARNTEKAV